MAVGCLKTGALCVPENMVCVVMHRSKFVEECLKCVSSSYVLPAVSRWHNVSYKLAPLLSRMCCCLILFLDQSSSCVYPGVLLGSPLKCVLEFPLVADIAHVEGKD